MPSRRSKDEDPTATVPRAMGAFELKTETAAGATGAGTSSGRPRPRSRATIHLTAKRWYKNMALDPFFKTSAEANASSWRQNALVEASLLLSTACSSLISSVRTRRARKRERGALFPSVRRVHVQGCHWDSASADVFRRQMTKRCITRGCAARGSWEAAQYLDISGDMERIRQGLRSRADEEGQRRAAAQARRYLASRVLHRRDIFSRRLSCAVRGGEGRMRPAQGTVRLLMRARPLRPGGGADYVQSQQRQ